mmetsp:Transcript_20367/g.38473  ORF Transcript_20367/g.38473 Transcript_20367/m.38473 type:complete len:126 (-) Transcript_20367:128-505(-)
MSRYTRLLNEDHDQTDATTTTDVSSSSSSPIPPPPSAFSSTNNNLPSSQISNMFHSLKESATSAGGSMRENMTKNMSSVRSGLGIPVATSEDDSEAPSESSMIDEVSELCPKMTFQQVRERDFVL